MHAIIYARYGIAVSIFVIPTTTRGLKSSGSWGADSLVSSDPLGSFVQLGRELDP